MLTGKRHAARELALQMLFQVDIGRIPVGDVLEGFDPDEELGEPPAEAIAFAHDLVRGTALHLAEIDDLLAGFAEEWAFDRMANVDRNILRLAVYELLHEPDVPEEVAINEAVELAKTFSTEESGKFVNGILGNLSRQRATGTLGKPVVTPTIEDEAEEETPEADIPVDSSEDAETLSATERPRRKRQTLRLGPEAESESEPEE